MDLGLGIVSQFDPEADMRPVADHLRRQTRRADDHGLDFVRVAEHHATEDNYLLNEATAASLVEASGDMTLDTMCLLPYHNPVRIAEFGATVDVLTGGRFRLTVALGYRPEEYAVFGVEDTETAIGRLVEGLEVIERLWTEDSVTYEGDYHRFEDVSINPKPLQEPRPPIYAGASNESSIRRAARLVDGWCGAHVPFDVAGRQIADFRDECQKRGEQKAVGLTREVCVGETADQALEMAREPLVRKYGSYSSWGQDDAIADDEFDREWAALSDDRFIVGNPDEVAAELERYRDAFDLDYVSVRTQWKGMPWADVHRSQELLCSEVVPAIRERAI
jgi:alkanesulfonate monooxygenase SsuD/methylene tetrahydromethanopterin reductase-like flavin-dependent oxidoreductase (luciferase family)